MKTKLSIRRGRWTWNRADAMNKGMSFGTWYALANGIRPESWLRNPSQFAFSFGAYGWTRVRVWASAGDYDSAFETAVEWLDDHAPGYLVRLTDSDFQEAAKTIGLEWHPDLSWNADQEEIRSKTEADLIIIGHTTLKHGQYVLAHECQCQEIPW